MSDIEPGRISENATLPSNRFARARTARQSEVAEDYVELIAELIETRGEARAADIARMLGVTHVTVVKTVARLARDGWVVSQPHRPVCLTQIGQDLARRTKARHDIVWRFLLAIGVDPATAHADAEGMEHHVSQVTLNAFARMTQAMTERMPDTVFGRPLLE